MDDALLNLDAPSSAAERGAQSDLPVDAETGAWVLSFVAHLLALFLLTWASFLIPSNEPTLLTSPPPELMEEIPPSDFEVSDDLLEEIGALADANSATAAAAAPIEELITDVVLDIEPESLVGEIQSFEPDMVSMAGPTLNEDLAIKGVGAVGTTGAAGAVDALSNEILLSIDQRPTLVVWLFDQSGSLSQQRQRVVKRFDRVYEELGVIEAAGNPAFRRHQDKPLLTSVAQFGQGFELLTQEPTDDLSAIKSAVRSVKVDESGAENVFTAVAMVAQQFRFYRLKAPRRNVMIVVLTDEAGDDIQRLDATVDVCQKLAMPVYVVGTPAPFGRNDAYVRYSKPGSEYNGRFLPVHQGPESLMPERIHLGRLGDDERQDRLDSGFGPFGLTRLAYETGGQFFAVHPNRKTNRRLRRGETGAMASYMSRFFDPRVMRRYRPDYVSVAVYRQEVSRNRAKRALVEAASLSQTEPMENIQTAFVKLDEAEFSESLTRAQRAAAKLEPKLQRLTSVLRAGEPDRPKLDRPRWQAGYDLAMGRALAVKVRTEGYNSMLARAKQGMAFKEKSDTWVLIPSEEVTSSSVLAKEAEAARTYLKRVAEEHDQTPWAYLAERELKKPLGWEWKEEFRNVVAMREQAQQNQNRPRRNRPDPPRPKPGAPPKL